MKIVKDIGAFLIGIVAILFCYYKISLPLIPCLCIYFVAYLFNEEHVGKLRRILVCVFGILSVVLYGINVVYLVQMYPESGVLRIIIEIINVIALISSTCYILFTSSVIGKIDRPKKDIYCKNCGSLIDLESNKCTGCGRQYFKLKSPSAKTVVLLLCIAVIACLGYDLHQGKESLQAAVSTIETLQANQDSMRSIYVGYSKSELGEIGNKSDALDDMVCFVAPNGVCYHKFGCRYVKNSDWTAYFIKDAKKLGYKPCPECYPDK